ncbi:MAG: hypothetical protein ACLGI8_04455 [Acidimicrobiia bacterium]
MARQLSLLESRRTWTLSDSTREVGRRGVAEARAALDAARAAAEREPASTGRDRRGRRPLGTPHGHAA